MQLETKLSKTVSPFSESYTCIGIPGKGEAQYSQIGKLKGVGDSLDKEILWIIYPLSEAHTNLGQGKEDKSQACRTPSVNHEASQNGIHD